MNAKATTTRARRAAAGAALLATLAATVLWAHAARPSAPRSSAVDTGVVDIVTSLGYEGAAAAGTGIVLSNTGEVLTNNHVIRGATTIRVSDPGTGRSYRATVVGYDISADIALLKVNGAASLQTAPRGSSSGLTVGEHVTAVGNAGGTGGTPTVTSGRVTALHQAITVGDETGLLQRLTGLIETDASLQPGESGGPLLDRANRVIGIDTAASPSFRLAPGRHQGFAIPIDSALSIVRQIEAGRPSAAVHVGPTAFLGIDVAPSTSSPGSGATSGVLVRAVVRGSPAEHAGLAPGDVIVALDGRTISSPTSLTSAMLRVPPGATVHLRWLDPAGNVRSGDARPISGPPQ
jgi:S1-C subfamily serine protease